MSDEQVTTNADAMVALIGAVLSELGPVELSPDAMDRDLDGAFLTLTPVPDGGVVLSLSWGDDDDPSDDGS